MAPDSRPFPELTVEIFSGSSTRVPPPSETPVAAAVATGKLRGSCQACATSKVKCNKEKPTCSRCTRRGTACQYWATKRPGRKRNRNQPSGRRPPPQVPAVATTWSGDFAEALMSEVVSPGQGQRQATTPPGSIPQWLLTAPDPGPALALDVMRDLELGSSWPLHCPPSLASESVFHTLASGASGLADLAGLSTSPTPLINPTDAPDAAEQSLDTISPTAAATSDISSVFARNTEVSHCSSHSRQTNLSPRDTVPQHPSTSSHYLLPDEPPLDSPPDGCHVQALRLVRVCLHNRTTKKPSCAKADQQPQPLSPPAVAGENKRTIEAVQAVLGCTCSAGDGALLVMLCLAVLMVLDAYTVAAQRQDQEGTEYTPRTSLPLVSSADQSIASSSSSSPRSRSRSRSLSFLTAATTPISHTSIKALDRHLDRMMAQLILGELHRVQRVAKEIAGRLEGYHDFCGSLQTGTEEEVNFMSLGDETHMPFFFSATTCKEMAQDLRERVSALAKSLIETLRKW